MSFDLTHPQYLFGLTLIVLIGGAYRYSLIDFSRRQRLVSLAVRKNNAQKEPGTEWRESQYTRRSRIVVSCG
jgi:hypothetical protein